MGLPRRTGGLRGQRWAARWQGIRAVGLLARGEARGTGARQRPAPSPESPDGPPLRRRARRLRPPASPAAARERWRSALGLLGRAALERWQREGLATATRPPVLGPQSGEPGPRAAPGDGADKSVPRGGEGREERGGSGWSGAGPPACAILPQATDVQGAGLQGAAAVTGRRWGVEAPEGSSACA